MISFNRNIIFIHNQKCGGTSIEKSFFTREEYEFHYKNDKIFGKLYHSGISSYIKQYDLDFAKKCTIFSSARNPWSRIISFIFWRAKFKGVIIDNLTKDLFLSELYDPEQGIPLVTLKSCIGNNISPELNTPKSNILKIENITNELSEFCERNNFSYQPVSTLNTSNHLHYRHYYDKETRDIIGDLFSDDINFFNYDF
jgi:hypothetical protein